MTLLPYCMDCAALWTKAIGIIDALGRVGTAITLILLVALVILWIAGIIPVILRFGNGLSRRQVAIFASGDVLDSLRQMLRDSGLVKERNIVGVSERVDVGRADSATLLIVYWPDWKSDLTPILQLLQQQVALVVYAPPQHGQIPLEVMKELGERPNVVVSNFRGRLLNDIAGCLITTSYAKKRR